MKVVTMTFNTLLLSSALTLMTMTAAHAASVTFDEVQLEAGTVSADATSVEVTSGGLTLNANTDPLGDGRVRTFRVGNPKGGLWFGATVGNNFSSAANNATAPADAVYSMSFDQAITSISFSFDYLTDGASRPQPEKLSEFMFDMSAATISASGLAKVSFDAGVQTVTADALAGGGTAGTGTITFDSGGVAFNSFSFRHQQTPENIGFTVNTIIVDVAAVPLPAGLPLLLAGVAGLGLVRQRAKT